MNKKVRKYKITNVHPTYESEEQKQEAYTEIALSLALIANYYGNPDLKNLENKKICKTNENVS